MRGGGDLAFGFASGPLAVGRDAGGRWAGSARGAKAAPGKVVRKARVVMSQVEGGAGAGGMDDHGDNPILKEATKRVLKDFLTRRAVRTILYYFLEFNDAPSRNWLLQFDDFESRDKAKSFKDSDAYITKMLTAPNETCTVVQAHPRGYFRREFKFQIVPSQIAHRILAARAQLADEFAVDLRLIRAENEEIGRQHLEKLVTSEDKLNRTKNLVFDHDPFSGNKSPLRAKNYKEFKLLITDLAAGRALVRYREEQGHHYLWLGEYMHSHPITDGDQFVAELLSAPTVSKSNPDTIISPSEIARDVMEYREIIAQEWIETLQGVPEENLTIERTILERSFVSKSEGPHPPSDQAVP